MFHRPHQRRALNATEQHRAWLQLVDTDGPFLAVPVLKRVWPDGIPNFATIHPERYDLLHDKFKTFGAAFDAVDAEPESEELQASYRQTRDQWVETVLRAVVGWGDTLDWGETTGIRATSPNRAVTIHSQGVLRGADGIGALVHIVERTVSLRSTPADLWATTPIDRMDALLRASGVPIGIVTDGQWWGLVCSRESRMTASGIVDALTWISEPRTRDAFFTLLDRQYIIGGDPDELLPELFKASETEAEETTEALGAQVRSAVELLIQAFAEAAVEAKRRGQGDSLPDDPHATYEAAVTVMMRVVFLLFAEERGLLPSGDLFDQGYGIAQELARLETREAAESEEILDSTTLTWHRLLATSQALYTGASFENLRMPAYGGSLFDPTRFPFLNATTEQGSLAVAVSDRVMLHVLRSVQLVKVGGESRHISFRDIDVEQIGYIYEGLLGFTCRTVGEVYVGLQGTAGAEPDIPLARLETLRAENPTPAAFADALRAWLVTDQPSTKPKSASAIARALDALPDPIIVSALTQAVGGDTDLRAQIEPWLGLIRPDLRNQPFIVLPGGLLVKETPSRKNAGAHYTPRSLAEEVVLHALQPLCYSPGPYQSADESRWVLKGSVDILRLRIADIACGSGAFLVAAARYLADRMVEAWTIEDPSNTYHRDLYSRAIRQVVAKCLYGADINGMAVEMCKLSLWLVSLNPKLPFSFVDDKVLHGNSLLGLTDLDQIRELHIYPADARSNGDRDALFYTSAGRMMTQRIDVNGVISRVAERRQQLASEVSETDPARTATAKRRIMADNERDLVQLTTLADAVVAAGLPLGAPRGRDKETTRPEVDPDGNARFVVEHTPDAKLQTKYKALAETASVAFPKNGDGDRSEILRLIDTGLTPTVETDYDHWRCLHWVLAVPDVMERGGFNAIIGNPPFLGGQKLTGAMGTDVRDWFVNVLAEGRRGSADLVAYFFLRATSLLQANGTLGLIATNTVAQGDTREVGLDAMVAEGFTITRAIQSRSWPAASANLEYAAVWGTRAAVADAVSRVADDSPVRRISTLLEPAGRVEGNPVRLAENTGIAFQGCIVLGMGFVIEPELAHEWIAADARNAEVLLPYLNGEDLNSRPDASASRWVIDFNDRSEEEAAKYELPYARTLELVKPERQRLNAEGSFVLRRPLPERWWQYGEKRPAMRQAIAALSEVLVIALVSKTVMPVRVPTGQVFSHALGVFASDDYSDQAVLSSSLHQAWAITYGSGMRNDPRYTPSDVFETFARPAATGRLESVGQILDSERRTIMVRRNLGLTSLYNMVSDPDITSSGDHDIARLRDIHVELDDAVLDAYGWSDIDLQRGFHVFRQMRRWTVSPAARIEILGRLLEENHHRGDR
ncbi:MAG: SAM-dependent DNA methyltransferase [Propionibacteriaceae bacterium]|nr:SAM-dependent DNA methyltransferase [Propionibacteriaceae bacterium]